MKTDLDEYKKRRISELVAKYNTDMASLKTILTNNLNSIKKMRYNPRVTAMYANYYISIYNNNAKKLKDNLTKDITTINLLTHNPDLLVVPTIQIQEIQPSKKAVLVGINYEGTSHQLYGCINDVENVKKLLMNNYNYQNENILLLTDKTEKKPTKQNIINEFTNLLRNSSIGDFCFFMYSGHGTGDVCTTGDEPDRQDELIFPLNATYINDCIRDNELNKIIQDNLKPGVKLFALFDCCFSGSILDLKYNQIDNVNMTNNGKDTVSLVCMISGCKDNQTSADTYVEINNQGSYSGAMTYAFIKTIQDKGVSTDYKSLIDNMRTILKTEKYTQIPQLSSGIPIDVNSVVLI